MSERWLSIEEISAHLEVGADAVYRRAQPNQMPVQEVNGWVKLGWAGQKES